MKLGIIADTHFGYSRFEEDAFRQAEYALLDAERKADILFVAGDVFDVKIPKLETLERAAKIFSKLKKPVYVIHGNHERRSRDMVNPVQLLSLLSNVRYVHGKTETIEAGGETISVLFFGSVPEELAKTALAKLMEGESARADAEDGALDRQSSKRRRLETGDRKPVTFRILLMHQSIKELVYGGEDELSLDDLRDLPFDLIINGHIHKHHVEMGGRLIIPGSTVITQLRNDEQGERGYVLYDTVSRKAEFVTVPSRLFFYRELEFENASLADVKGKVDGVISEIRQKHQDAIVKIKLNGTLREGLIASDLSLAYSDGIYVQNSLNVESIAEKIRAMRGKHEEKLSVREVAVKQLAERLKGKLTLFEPSELFEHLAESAESGMEYLNRVKNKGKV